LANLVTCGQNGSRPAPGTAGPASGAQRGAEAVTEISLSYLLCATPRTGSNFLCEVLSSAGVAGYPEEYFWQRSFWYERWGVSDFPSFIDRVREHGTSRNGVFGSKLMWDQMYDLLRELVTLLGVAEESPARVLDAAFPNLHYVWLRRTDRLRQSISYYRALETRRWRSTDTTSIRPEPASNFESIRSLIQLCEWEDASWQEFFPTECAQSTGCEL
jgi:trehalose 2-sulfotransferase